MRKRTKLTQNDIYQLEVIFSTHRWPSREIKKKLAMKLKKHEVIISTWFQNRRARSRRRRYCNKDEHSVTSNTWDKAIFHEVKDESSRKYSAKSLSAMSTKTLGKGQEVYGDSEMETNKDSDDWEMNGFSGNWNIPMAAGLDMESYRRLVHMAAATEGTLSPHNARYNDACRDAFQGIEVQNGRIIYKRDVGFSVLIDNK